MGHFTTGMIFRDHGVFQAGKPVRVFGESDMAGKITVSLNGVTAETEAIDGKWLAELPSMEYGGPYVLKVEAPDGTVLKYEDIYVGEVLLLGGQSNMQVSLLETEPDGVNYDSNPMLRSIVFEGPIEDRHFKKKDGWVLCDKETVKYWSAIGYHAGDIIQKTKGVAVGLVCCFQGTSPIQSWLPKEVAAKPEYQTEGQLREVFKFEPEIAQFLQDGFLYEYSFSHVGCYSVGTVSWYQGEANTSDGESEIYGDMLTDLVSVWRKDLRDSDLKFIIIQIANTVIWPYQKGWKKVQKIQEEFCKKMPRTQLVISGDVCSTDELHPCYKRRLAERVANAIMA